VTELLVEEAHFEPLLTREEVRTYCEEAVTRKLHSIAVPSSRVEEAYQFAADSGLKVSCLVGFPFGSTDPDVKRFETEAAIDFGAQEIDLMVSLSRLKEGAQKSVLREIRDVVEAADGLTVKAFIEPQVLTALEVEQAVQVVLDSGAQYICTTLWRSGSVLEEVRRLRELAGPDFGVIAVSSDWNLDHEELRAAGANRLFLASLGKGARVRDRAFGI
jgi:deoxyribose-phosphate aldolase